ncbi:MAG TPA: tetratricopeptide repeat protein [Levilinea sp.]|nr:tetratricopeptide repeat protein [Levilinea sp.]
MKAIHQGEQSRARDLLTRLIKTAPNQASYWLWMSAVVETSRERIFCLKEVLRIDSHNEDARRGLILMGAAPPDESLAIPLHLQKRNWKLQVFQTGTAVKVIGNISKVQIGLAAAVLLIMGILAGIALLPERAPATASAPRLTALITLTPSATATPFPVTETPAPSGLVPLVMLLEKTYTPTPLYVHTPHPRSEAYRLGIFAYGRKEWAAVLNYMQQVATLEPNAPDIFYYIGEAQRFQQRYSEAIEAYNHAMKIKPVFAPAYLGRARATLALDPARWSAAMEDLETAIGYDAALMEAYLELARIDLAHRTPQDALKRLEMAAELAAGSPLLYHYRAAAYLLLNEPELALSDALRVQQLDMTFLPGYRQVGQAYQLIGDSSKALEALEIYTRYVTDDAEAFYWLGLAYQSRNEPDQALKAFSQAISLNNRLPGAHYQRGIVYLQIEEADQAENDLRQALRRDPQDFAINLALGKAFMLQERFSNAYAQFSQTVEFAKTPLHSAELLYYRAQTLVMLNERAAAAQDWTTLLGIEDAEIPLAWKNMAEEWLSQYFTPTPAAVTPSPTLTRQRAQTSTPTPSRTPPSS